MKQLNTYLKMLCFASIVVFIIIKAWCSDDAYHAYIMEINLLNGAGFTPTPGIRVNVSTCPLWTLINAMALYIIGDVYATGMVLNILFSSLAIYILIFKIIKDDDILLVLSTGMIIVAKAFISYTTSGLENSLLFFLIALYLDVFLHNEVFGKEKLFILALIEGLIAFTRMDAALILSVSSAVAYLRYRDRSEEKDYISGLISVIPIALLGLLPFLIWEIFSYIYYGLWVPLTALAKLNTGYSTGAYISRGIWYFAGSALFDFITTLIPIVFVVYEIVCWAINRKYTRSKSIALGVAIYLSYIMYIGGDFMKGRHYTVVFLTSLITLAYEVSSIKCSRTKKIIAYSTMIAFIGLNRVFTVPLSEDFNKVSPYIYTDERINYMPYTGLINVLHDIKENGEVTLIPKCKFNGIQWFYGDKSYYEYRLYDPLLARLPAIESDDWMVGHMERTIPEGYFETISTGRNLIKDADLKQYYDYLYYIISGDVWNVERIKACKAFNNGEYEYLREKYLKRMYDN